jgi:Fe-S-cluster containining protein
MNCRIGCGACCIAPSISSAIPGMPNGKAAGVRCIQLDNANRCQLFGKPERPAVCVSLQAETTMCGDSRAMAISFLSELEIASTPN